MKTRRQFIRSGMMGMAATWTLPAFLNETILRMDLQAANSPIQVTNGKDGTILVVVQLGGGNDGLNTIVPWADDAYFKARPNLKVAASEVLKIDDYMGFAPQMTGLKSLYDQGHLALINGVGYPNPNRSHFRSMEIWHTASDSDKNEAYGWLGRYFDNTCQGVDPTVGVNIGKQMPQAFAGTKPNGMTMSNPRQFLLQQDPGALINDDAEEMAGASIGTIGISSAPGTGDPLDYLERTALDAEVSSEEIQKIIATVKTKHDYPNNGLARDLQLVAQLIAGGMKSRVYYVSQGGYDTHANQANTHARLTGDFSSAIEAFCQDLKKLGLFDRVLVLGFSEFGRRVQENSSNGTDHGAAGPGFVLGGAVKGGNYGKYPSLTELERGDLMHNVDFRSIYGTILDQWMKVDSSILLKQKFPHLAFV